MTTDRREARQSGVRQWLRDHDLDALLITHLPNIRYLTGFTGSAGLLVVRPNESVVITDFRYAVQAPGEVGDAAVVVIEQSSVWQRLRRHIEGYQTLGFESAVLSVREAQRLGEGTSTRLVPTYDVVDRFGQPRTRRKWRRSVRPPAWRWLRWLRCCPQ